MRDPQSREVAQPHGLRGHREGAGDHRLGGDHRRGGGKQDQGQPGPAGREQEEGAAHRGTVAEYQYPLPDIAERARGQDETQPVPGDRLSAEVPHIGVQCLGTGDREDDGGEGEERDMEMPCGETERVGR